MGHACPHGPETQARGLPIPSQVLGLLDLSLYFQTSICPTCLQALGQSGLQPESWWESLFGDNVGQPVGSGCFSPGLAAERRRWNREHVEMGRSLTKNWGLLCGEGRELECPWAPCPYGGNLMSRRIFSAKKQQRNPQRPPEARHPYPSFP